MIITDFADFIATRMRSEHRTLAARWFDRLLDVLPVDAREIFPSESLLDHVPALILEIGEYLRQPAGEAIASNTAILGKAAQLGSLRHSQQASLHQVLREYQLLGSVLVGFVLEELEAAGTPPGASEAVQLVSRLHQAVDVLSQATVETFVGLYTKTITDQAERLDQFTRVAAHEWRQPLGVLQLSVHLLREAKVNPSHVDGMLATVDRNVRRLIEVAQKLEALQRVRSSGDNAVVQTVPVGTVAQEAARQLAEMATARGVEIRIGDTQTVLTVDVGRLELVFVNLLSNAIKYSDPRKAERYVELLARSPENGVVEIHVRDNGVGIPEAALASIFQRFTRAHADDGELTHVAGIGLGLSIVEDCVHAMGGQIVVQSAEKQGATFIMTLPVGDGPTGQSDGRGVPAVPGG